MSLEALDDVFEGGDTAPSSSDLLSNEQREFISACLEYPDKHFFLTGKAGTGKTFTIEQLKESFYLNNHRFITCAFTGAAALNCGGMTLHRCLGLRHTDNIFSIQETKHTAPVLLEVGTIIIDEISMVRADMLDMLDIIARQTLLNDEDFGGLQIIMVGDAMQLPPVVPNQEVGFFRSTYKCEQGYFFSSKVFRKISKEKNLGLCCLTEVFRQKDDKFLGLLNDIRCGENIERIVSDINDKCIDEYLPDSTVLVKDNATKDKLNKRALEDLPGKPVEFIADVTNPDIKDSQLSAPRHITLKEGLRVMCIKNHYRRLEDGSTELVIANGDLGEVLRIEEDDGGAFVMVQFDRIPEPVIVRRLGWEEATNVWDKKDRTLKNKVLSGVSQMPLVPAAALTVHKAQGKTLDNVTIDLTKGMASPGMFYTAITRLRAFEGLSVKGRMNKFSLSYDEKLRKFDALVNGRKG